VFLYSVTPEHALLRFSEMYSIHPLDDGFTASMKALMRKACEVRNCLTALTINLASHPKFGWPFNTQFREHNGCVMVGTINCSKLRTEQS
jgi:hypothetical protein